MRKLWADHSYLPSPFSMKGSLQCPVPCRLSLPATWGWTCPCEHVLGVLGDSKTKLLHWWLLVRVCKSLSEAGGWGAKEKWRDQQRLQGSGLGYQGPVSLVESLSFGGCVTAASLVFGVLICKEKRICPMCIRTLPGKRILEKKKIIKWIRKKSQSALEDEKRVFFFVCVDCPNHQV